MNKTTLFVVIVLFWVLLAGLGSMFDLPLMQSSRSDIGTDNYDETGAIKSITGNYTDTGKVATKNYLSIFRIMSFQATNEVPMAITLILDAIAIFTVYLLFSLIRGSG